MGHRGKRGGGGGVKFVTGRMLLVRQGQAGMEV